MGYRQKRTVVHRIGDSCAEDHGGGALMRVGSRLVLEYTHGAESDFTDTGLDVDTQEGRNACLEVYRIDVPTIGRSLCDIDGIRSDLDWCDWPAVARCADLDAWDLLEIALDPKRAWALYEIAAMYYGWRELDLEPSRIPYWRVSRMWTKPFRTAKAG